MTPVSTWLLLVGITLLSGTLSQAPVGAMLASSGIILIAMLKARLITSHFMEVKSVHRTWRRILDCWIALVFAIILIGYWVGS